VVVGRGYRGCAGDADGLDTVDVAQGPPRQNSAPDAPPVDVQALTGKAHRVFIVCVHQAVLSNVTLEQAKQALTALEPVISEGEPVMHPEDGEVIEIEEELPANLPKSRMRKADLRTLKELGVLDDPDSQLAEEVGSWTDAAQALADSTDHA